MSSQRQSLLPYAKPRAALTGIVIGGVATGTQTLGSAGKPAGESDDISVVSILSMLGAAYRWSTNAGSPSLNVWMQTKIGGGWFDVPGDLRMKRSSAAADVDAGLRKRNIEDDATDSASPALFATVYKHMPWVDLRYVWLRDGKGACAKTATIVVEGK